MVKIGLYDSLMLKFKCPYCKEVSKMEFQTKDGKCFMNTYKKGQVFDNGQFRFIDAYGTCQSLTCQLESAKESIWTRGYYGGFSRGFDAIVYCDKNGRITNKIKITNLSSHKGIMKGKLGELKGEYDNMKMIKPLRWNKKGKMLEPIYRLMTTNGWLDKFNEDSFNNGKQKYEVILYLFNLEDGEEAFKLWFGLRYKLEKIIKILGKDLRLKENKEYVSVFLSNPILDIINFTNYKNESKI